MRVPYLGYAPIGEGREGDGGSAAGVDEPGAAETAGERPGKGSPQALAPVDAWRAKDDPSPHAAEVDAEADSPF